MTIEFLLKSPIAALPAITSVADARLIAVAARKYDMPGALSAVSLLLRTSPTPGDPYDLFALASICGWREVMQDAAVKLLDVPLDRQRLRAADFDHVMLLVKLRESRLVEFAVQLASSRFAQERSAQCLAGHKTKHVTLSQWATFAAKLQAEFAQKPSRSWIAQESYLSWTESNCLNSLCYGIDHAQRRCAATFFDKDSLKVRLLAAVDALPIELDPPPPPGREWF